MAISLSQRYPSRIYFSVTLLFILFRSAALYEPDYSYLFCKSKECSVAGKILKQSMNLKVHPCDNFYQYACGNYPIHHPNNGNEPQNQFRLRSRENTAEILNFLKQNNSALEPDSVHKARKLFQTCTDRNSFRNSTKPIDDILQKLGIPKIPFVLNKNRTLDYATVLAKLARLTGIKLHFDVGTRLHPQDRFQNIITISSRKNLVHLQQYSNSILPYHKSNTLISSIQTMSPVNFTIDAADKLCINDNSRYCQEWSQLPLNSKEAFVTVMIQTAMHNSDLSRSTMWPQNLWSETTPSVNNTCEKPRVFTLKQIQDLTDGIGNEIKPSISKINWTRYIEETFDGIDGVTLDLSDPSQVEIAIADYNSLNQTIRYVYKTKTNWSVELEIWFELMTTFLQYLHWNVSQVKGQVSISQKNLTREEYCSKLTVLKMDTAVSYMYTQLKQYEDSRNEIKEMFDFIKENLRKTIQKSSWIDKQEKEKFLLKLDWVYYYVLYPEIVMNKTRLDEMYQNVVITQDLYDSIISIVQSQIIRDLQALNKVNQLHDERHLPFATDANAFYDLNKNHIMIPGGILGGAFYRKGSILRVLNYGSLGTIIGHELTHGFDFTGRCYDHLGNYKNWWNTETLKKFKKKEECFIKAYDGYNTTIGGVTQKGISENTLCEDMSDNGGFRAALYAYRSRFSKYGSEVFLQELPNLTHEQLFTVAFANVWCENPSPDSHNKTRSNTVHSPNGVRVNGVLRNSKEFAEIWGCSKGTDMNPSDDKCTIW